MCYTHSLRLGRRHWEDVWSATQKALGSSMGHRLWSRTLPLRIAAGGTEYVNKFYDKYNV